MAPKEEKAARKTPAAASPETTAVLIAVMTDETKPGTDRGHSIVTNPDVGSRNVSTRRAAFIDRLHGHKDWPPGQIWSETFAMNQVEAIYGMAVSVFESTSKVYTNSIVNYQNLHWTKTLEY